LRRWRDTAAPFAQAIGVALEIDAALGEIPAPVALTQQDRPAWLGVAMGGRWSDIVGDIDYDRWRHAVTDAVSGYAGYAVFSHFVAINAVLSVLSGDERVIGFRPDHASITTLATSESGLRLVERGAEAATDVA
jgi:broad specificity phosphatase PhoE